MKENQERDTNGRFKKTRPSYSELQQKADNQAKQLELANKERNGIINNSNRKDREILTLKDRLFEKEQCINNMKNESVMLNSRMNELWCENRRLENHVFALCCISALLLTATILLAIF